MSNTENIKVIFIKTINGKIVENQTVNDTILYIDKYFSKYAQSNEIFNDIIFCVDKNGSTLLVPIELNLTNTAVTRYFIKRLFAKSDFFGFNKNTTFIIPSFIVINDLFTKSNYDYIISNISKGFKII